MQSPQLSQTMGAMLVCTAVSSLVAVVMLSVLGAALTPGYSHVSQFVSELGATGAPTELWVRFGGFLPAGLLMLTFCAGALRVLPRTPSVVLGLFGLAVYAAGYLVASVFPCDLGCRPAVPSTSQLIHNLGGMVGYLLAPASLFMLALAARGWPDSARLVVAGYVAATVALVGLLTLSPSSALVGVSQRALEAAVLGWVVVLGWYLLGQSHHQGRTPADQR